MRERRLKWIILPKCDAAEAAIFREYASEPLVRLEKLGWVGLEIACSLLPYVRSEGVLAAVYAHDC
jgi:hypothetical protein